MALNFLGRFSACCDNSKLTQFMGKVWYNVFVRRNFFSATVGENKMYIFDYYNCQITYFLSSDIQEELKQTIYGPARTLTLF